MTRDLVLFAFFSLYLFRLVFLCIDPDIPERETDRQNEISYRTIRSFVIWAFVSLCERGERKKYQKRKRKSVERQSLLMHIIRKASTINHANRPLVSTRNDVSVSRLLIYLSPFILFLFTDSY